MSTHTNKSSILITSLFLNTTPAVFSSQIAVSEISHWGENIIRKLSANKQLMLSLHVTVIIFLVYVQCLNLYAIRFILPFFLLTHWIQQDKTQ